MSKITAPFTPEQVEQLNRYQALGLMHPFTCATKEKHSHPALRTPVINPPDDVLVATETGFHCPTCDYTQNWAYSFMADKKQLDDIVLANAKFFQYLKSQNDSHA